MGAALFLAPLGHGPQTPGACGARTGAAIAALRGGIQPPARRARTTENQNTMMAKVAAAAAQEACRLRYDRAITPARRSPVRRAHQAGAPRSGCWLSLPDGAGALRAVRRKAPRKGKKSCGAGCASAAKAAKPQAQAVKYQMMTKAKGLD